VSIGHQKPSSPSVSPSSADILFPRVAQQVQGPWIRRQCSAEGDSRGVAGSGIDGPSAECRHLGSSGVCPRLRIEFFRRRSKRSDTNVPLPNLVHKMFVRRNCVATAGRLALDLELRVAG
jgi:hypothetical protein